MIVFACGYDVVRLLLAEPLTEVDDELAGADDDDDDDCVVVVIDCLFAT